MKWDCGPTTPRKIQGNAQEGTETMTEQDKREITETIKGIIEANAPKETNADKRRRILAIKDTTKRQKAIRENMELFAGVYTIGGKKSEEN